MYTYTYIYIYITHTYIYIYMYRERERERERERDWGAFASEQTRSFSAPPFANCTFSDWFSLTSQSLAAITVSNSAMASPRKSLKRAKACELWTISSFCSSAAAPGSMAPGARALRSGAGPAARKALGACASAQVPRGSPAL